MNLEEIRNNPAIMMHLRFDLTQEMLDAPGALRFHPRSECTERIRNEHIEQAGFYFCIHAWNHKPRLALIHFLPDGEMKTEDIQGFPERFLIEAVQESSASLQHAKDRIYVGGHFPINKPVEEMLRLGLQTVKEKGNTMHFEDIKNPALRKLFAELKHASSTIENDAGDALNESSNDEELINNWQSKLMDLYNECQYYWGALENMKSGKGSQ